MDEQYQQMNLFNFDKEYKKIDKPIRLIELFAGIGAQAKALEILGVPFEHYKICEWAVPSILAYNAIHIKDTTDYSQGKTKEEMLERINGVSSNYNEPITYKTLKSKPIEWIKKVYNNIVATHNLINIMNVKGKDLEIVDTDKYEYIMTYSFPCQDLSLAGQGKGMAISQADGGTRSGLLWEVERILDELKQEQSHLPQILLMENVPEVIGTNNLKHFHKWLYKLESLGYSNFFDILNGKNYGIPQNRRRCFMISVLGDYAYDFPVKLKLKYRLKDFLEKQVDEKYYLSDKLIEFFTYNTEKQKSCGNGFTFQPISATDKDSVAKTVTTRNGSRMDDNFIDETHGGGLRIMESTKQGYKIAHEGDGVNLAGRMRHQRGNVQKGSIQTLKTQMEIGVVVNDKELCDGQKNK